MNILPSNLPNTPWVYKFFDHKGQILYIGKAKNIAKRIQQYFSPWSLWKQEMVATAQHIEWIETPTEADALLLEDSLIKQKLPEYNKLLRNNTNYVFLKISKGSFPLFTLVRKRINDGSNYIWPKYASKQLWLLLRHLRQLFQFHTMKASEFEKWTLSSDYFFWLDKGRSVIACLSDPKKLDRIQQATKQWRKAEKSYEEYVKDYKQITTIIRNCFEWRTKVVLDRIEQELKESIQKQHYERCAKLRDIYHFVQTLEHSYQHIVMSNPVDAYIAQIQAVGDHWVIILLHLIEGKVVDILREHKKINERELSTLQASIAQEFWTSSIKQQDDTLLLFATPSSKKISAKEWKLLEELFSTSVDAYVKTTINNNEANIMDALLLQLQQEYALSRIPLQMECIDISHFSWEHTSGWLSCFKGGVADKRGYRNYKIQSVAVGHSDDYQALKEVIVRRFKLSKSSIGTSLLPDLFIIDGGKWQLGIVRELIQEYPSIKLLMQQVDIVALGKWEARQRSKKSQGETEIIYKFDKQRNILQYPLAYHHADQLIVKLRDEAHRFANRYRKKQAEKAWR